MPAGQTRLPAMQEVFLPGSVVDGTDICYSSALSGSAGEELLTKLSSDPLAFSKFFLDVCRERGVHLHQPARVISVGTNEDGELESVGLESTGGEQGAASTTTLSCTRLVIAAGAWSGRVFDGLFGGAGTSRDIPISDVSGHSLLLGPSCPPSTDVYAVFVAAGHGAWGISMGPGTGLLVAELAQGRSLSADLSRLGFQG